MPSFADSFWTPDFATGIDVIFNKLNQGCVENQEFIDLFTSRMDYEEDYGRKLLYIPEHHAPSKTGFDRDDGASLKNAFKGIGAEMSEEGKHHLTIANNIKELVTEPFTKWSQEHKQRVQYSDQILKNSLKVYKSKSRDLEKVQKKYFNKCRTLETLKEGLTEDEILKELSLEDTASEITSTSTATEDYDAIVKLGGVEYGKIGLKELFVKILNEIPQNPFKVPILGVYEHVSTGSAITQWLQENLGISNVDKAETFGQDLITNGYLKKINTSVVPSGGNIFANSGSFHYQWKPSTYQIADIQSRSSSGAITGGDEDDVSTSKTVTSYIDGLKSTFEEPTLKKISKEVSELDESYKKEVKKLDKIRCDLEELIVDHLTFMEKCELDRLRALKKVILDFSASISNNITIIKAAIDRILVYEESISPNKDLLFLLQNYRTGPFNPKVSLYDNYYDSFKDQIFGVDLDTRCKNDNKTVPIIISSILSHMDLTYPELSDDEVRTKIWLIPVRLQSTHALRRAIEDAGPDGLTSDFYSAYEPEIIASVLKLYLLELPDSIVPSQLYDLIKSIYTQFGGDNESEQRVNGLINILKDLDRTNLQTLNAICTHFQRLISILKEKQSSNLPITFQTGVSQEFSNCILRPKNPYNLQFEDKHSFRFLFDLLEYKSQIFKSLKNTIGSRKNSSIKRNESTLKTRLEQAVKTPSHTTQRKVSNTPSVIEVTSEGEEISDDKVI